MTETEIDPTGMTATAFVAGDTGLEKIVMRTGKTTADPDGELVEITVNEHGEMVLNDPHDDGGRDE